MRQEGGAVNGRFAACPTDNGWKGDVFTGEEVRMESRAEGEDDGSLWQAGSPSGDIGLILAHRHLSCPICKHMKLR